MPETIRELISWSPPKVASLISSGILLPQTRMMIFGPAKAWKSMESFHLANCLATGQPWFGYSTTPCLPFIIQSELPKPVHRSRAEKFAKGISSSNTTFLDSVITKTIPYIKLDSGYGIGALDKEIALARDRFPEAHIVLILDPLYKMLSGHITEEYDVRKLLDNLDDIKEKRDLTIVLIHHSRLTRVDASGNVIDLGPEEAMGSSYINNWVDTMVKVHLLNPHSGGNRVYMSFELTRHAETILPGFTVEWSRATLQPRIIARDTIEEVEMEDISIRTEEE